MKELISVLTFIGIFFIACWLLGAAATAGVSLFVALVKVLFWTAIVLGILCIIGWISSQ